MHKPEWYTKYLEQGVAIKCGNVEEEQETLEICRTLGLTVPLGLSVMSHLSFPKKGFPVRYLLFPERKNAVWCWEDEFFLFSNKLPWQCDASTWCGGGVPRTQLEETEQQGEAVMTVKIDYVQQTCPKCRGKMKALWDLNNQYCPRGCND